MDYLFELVTENVYVLAVWDSAWNSYNNCYLVVKKEGVTLIDCGKKEHSSYLVEALNKLGRSPEDVTLIVATHGHEDHVQGAAVFKNAKKFIHPNERSHIEYPEPDEFTYELSDHGILEDYEYRLVGLHTPGSIAIFHQPSKILFTGDFLCFFGDPLSKDGLVSDGNDLKKEWLEYLRGGGVSKDHLDRLLEGLSTMKGFDAHIMCTGHGGVLVGDIERFISGLLEIGENLGKNEIVQ
ncbi:MBL fold metallo-hydrolase [Peribacillus deserti]|uniref:MBL fold metallo-hydrolase n=1 Tax=Peribacillus deserti TaxID=673318 RepID=UPI0015E13151|nr:MBL fold metallo-hydrolase [Peribacillus deserti]